VIEQTLLAFTNTAYLFDNLHDTHLKPAHVFLREVRVSSQRLKSLAEPFSPSDKFPRDSRPAGIGSGFAYSPEVSTLLGRMMSYCFRHFLFGILTGVVNTQSLSTPLQRGLRFFLHPLPAAPSNRLTAVLLRSLQRTTGLPRSLHQPKSRRRCHLSTGRSTFARATTELPGLPPCLLA